MSLSFGPGGLRSYWPALLVLAAGTVLSTAALLRRPDLSVTSGYLFGDQSLNLLVADELLAGRVLYRDIHSQYGPLPAYLHTGFAAVFGNTPVVFLSFHQVLSLVGLVLLTCLVRRATGAATTCFVVIVGLLPIFLTPGALLGAYTSSAYIPVERLCLIGLALAWVPPARRGPWSAAALGVILGAWQGVKFGGAFYAGLALLLTDSLALALARPPSLRPWLTSLAITGASFIAVETCWAVLAFSCLPGPIAVDALWPQYMLVQYASLQASPLPEWNGWRYFVGQQLTPLTGVLLGFTALAACVVVALRRRPPGGSEVIPLTSLRLFIPLLFFALGFIGYFRHAHLPLQYAWAGCLAGALVVDRLPRPAWLLLGLCWLPGLWLVVRADLISGPSQELHAVTMPTGDRLFLTDEEDSLVSGIRDELARVESEERTPRDGVLFYPGGAGMHHFFGIPRKGRHAWYLAGFVRPYEEADFIRGLDAEYAFVFVSDRPIADPSADPGELLNAFFARPVFSAPVCDALRAHLHNPVRVGPRCLVYRVR
jgi:hypothetical protein